MALSKLEMMITVPAGGWSISVTEVPAATASVTVAAADYFLTSTTALLTTLQTALNADGTLAGTYAVSLDDGSDSSTGKVTISATGVTTFAITWTSTALRDALGFTGTTAAALTTTGSSASPHVFLPPVKAMPGMHPDGSSGNPISDTTVVKAPSGPSKALHYGFTYEGALGFGMVIGNKARTQFEVVVNESFETFWTTGGMGKGLPFRYHADRATDGTYTSWRIDSVQAFPVVPAMSTWTSSAVAPFNIGPIPLIKYTT